MDISKSCSSCKLHLKVFKLVLNFHPNGSHKTTLGSAWNFEFLVLNFLFIFKTFEFTIVPYKPQLYGKRAIIE